MPKPARTTVCLGSRSANPTRGANAVRTGNTSELGSAPLNGPLPPAVTSVSVVNSWPGLVSTNASRPYFSVYGAKYSYRNPYISVSDGNIRQSSCAYSSITLSRR